MAKCTEKSVLVFRAVLAVGIGISLTGCVVVQAPATPSAESSTTPDKSPEGNEQTDDKAGSGSESPVKDDVVSGPGSPTGSSQSESAPGDEPAKDWADTIEETRSGIAHLLVTRCDDAGAGSGFLIDDDLVVTAAHVVKDAAEIVLRIDDELVSGEVLGTNDLTDIALVRTARDSKGHQFTFIDGEPRIGTGIYALGFPRNVTVKDAEGSDNGFTANAGAVTALNQTVDYGSGSIENMIRTDASVDSGNSGGPLITQDGEVVGLVSGVRMTDDKTPVNGWGYAVTAPRIVQAVAEWRERGTSVGLKSCADAPAPDGTTVYLEVNSSHDQATSIAHSLVAHGQAINSGNYRSAYEIFTGGIRERVGSVSHWSEGIETSYWLGLLVDDVKGTGDELVARARLVTAQDPEKHSPRGTTGQACSIWTMDYTMVWDGTRWLMEDVDSISTPEDCTAEMEHRDATDPQDGIGD